MTSGEADVVVIGGGGSGLMAAYSAARLGRRVIVLEKQARLGGTTVLSVGTISTTSTDLQKAAGIVDTPEEQFEDMGKFAGPLEARDNLELRRLYVNEVPKTYQALVDVGVEFVGPFAEPPHRYPRLHAIVPHSRGYIYHIEKACRRLGVDIRTGARASRLLTSGSRVCGVEFEQADGSRETVKARRAVVIASGDFASAERTFKERFLGGPLLQIGGINPGNTGDGHRLGESVGGVIVNGDLAWGPEIRFIAPAKPSIIAKLPPWRSIAKTISTAMKIVPNWLLRPFLMSYVTTYLAPSHKLFQEGAVLVNIRGARFCDELDRPQDHIGLQPEQNAFIIFDATVAKAFEAWPNFISTAPGVGYAYLKDYRRSRRDIYFSSDTLEGLAQAAGLPAQEFARTIADYNREAAKLGKPPLEKGPFVALGPAKSWILFTEGGLKVNAQLQALDAASRPIPGLYAAGSVGQGGVVLEGHGHHLGWIFTSGRLAGTHAAQQEPDETEPEAKPRLVSAA